MVSFDIIRIDSDGKVAEHWDAMMPQTPANPSGRTLTDGETTITGLDKTEANKQQISKWIDIRAHGSPEEVGAFREAFFAPDYKQHNPVAADGLQGFMVARKTEQWELTKLHKVLGEGNFVLSISEGMARGKHSVFYDLFRLEKGRVVEHWDVIQPIPATGMANNNGMFGFR
jgi:predicted SnoaL-like aldol condensation-catalyzing enzyme